LGTESGLDKLDAIIEHLKEKTGDPGHSVTRHDYMEYRFHDQHYQSRRPGQIYLWLLRVGPSSLEICGVSFTCCANLVGKTGPTSDDVNKWVDEAALLHGN
jgi:hypothetical protein